ncbi:MAG: fumarylacetoacetate hydrolase family protein [Chloroflexi bacterium]|nr:fumarylacetoacetate hydrolase family protein [Chloroflexota bacterium]
MRWATFRTRGTTLDRVGVVVDDCIYALEAGVRLIDFLGDDGERLARAGERAVSNPAAVARLSEVAPRAPIPRPPSLRDFYAFEQHVRAARQRRGLPMDPDWYELPVFYFSNPAGVIGPYDDVTAPPGCTQLDYELEAVAVVGLGGSNLDPAKAELHIAGFMVMNDWSARDIQQREMKLGLGPAKGKDFATSLGPFLVTPDEIAPYRKGRAYDLTMTASVNGREYSCASLADIYWSFGEMLAYASRGTELVSGDVIGSGTCGTGCILELAFVHGEEAYPWLRPGDVVELGVEHLGTLRSRVLPGPPLVPLRPR